MTEVIAAKFQSGNAFADKTESAAGSSGANFALYVRRGFAHRDFVELMQFFNSSRAVNPLSAKPTVVDFRRDKSRKHREKQLK